MSKPNKTVGAFREKHPKFSVDERNEMASARDAKDPVTARRVRIMEMVSSGSMTVAQGIVAMNETMA